MPRSGRRIAWRKDPIILERLADHARLEREGLSIRSIIARQQISADTFFLDRARLLDLAREAAGLSKWEQQQQADTWLRECIAEADRETAKPGALAQERISAQANKRASVEAWIKLWGLAAPQKVQHAGPEGGPIAIHDDRYDLTDPRAIDAASVIIECFATRTDEPGGLRAGDEPRALAGRAPSGGAEPRPA